MKDARLVGRNAVFTTLALIIDRGTLFVLTILLARYLGATGYGIYTFAMSFVFLFAVVVNLGFRTFLQREIARDKSKADTYLSNALVMRLLTSALSFGLIAIIINWTKEAPGVIYAVYLSALIMLLFSFAEFFQGVFIAYERMEYYTLFTVLLRVLSLMAVIIVIFLGGGVLPLLAALSAVHLLSLAFTALFAAKRFVHLSLRINFGLWKDLFHQVLPFAVMEMLIPIYLQIDRVFLSYMVNDTAVGEYAAAANMALAFVFISVSVSTASFPTISRLYGENNGAALAIYRACFKYLLAIALPIAIATSLLAPVIIKVVYGSGYSGSVAALRVLAFVFPFMFLSLLQGPALMAVGREKALARLTGLATGINIVSNLALIPAWGIVGAAVASLMTAALMTLGQYWLVWRTLGAIDLRQIGPPILVASIALTVTLYFLQHMNVILTMAVAPAVYFGVLYLTKFVSAQEVVLLRRLLWPTRS